MTDNDILAEYVREKRPEIEQSISFFIYKLCKRTAEVINGAIKVYEEEQEEVDNGDSD